MYLRHILPVTRLEEILEIYAKSTDNKDKEEIEEDGQLPDIPDRINMNLLCDKELSGNERYHAMDDDPEERLQIIVDHIQVLEYQKEIEAEEAKKMKIFDQKQDFMMLLHELSFQRVDPLFHSKTTFKTLCQDESFVSDHRFAVFVNQEELQLATQYFEEFCIAMEHILEADKQILKSFLREHRHPIKHNDTVPQLLRRFAKASRLSLIDVSHLRLLFKEMIGKQQHLVCFCSVLFCFVCLLNIYYAEDAESLY